jgi:rfaE bifunctional protein nucleotidyltransferase chain/domain
MNRRRIRFLNQSIIRGFPFCPPWYRNRINENALADVGVEAGLALSGLRWFAVGRFYTRGELVAARAEWKRAGRIVVFTNGCYDLLHPGHVRLLERARSLGDLLILALNTDASVQRLKGPSRPLIPETQRAALAVALDAVDAVTLFDEDTPRELIAAVLPDILVKGADWAHWIAGREEVEAAGGKVLALSLEPGYSTTGIVEGILSRNP